MSDPFTAAMWTFGWWHPATPYVCMAHNLFWYGIARPW